MPPPDCSFILSVEQGKLEAQAVLLVESLRQFGGRYAKRPVYAVSPRASGQMSQRCQTVLKSLGVHVVIEELLSKDEQYGTMARLAACVWAEKNLSSEIIVGLDDDMFFTGEPDFSLQATDLFARPVDVKGICTTGPGDLNDLYWKKIAAACAVDYEKIPWLETTLESVLVKACYNGGMIAVHRQLGLFQTAESMSRILKSQDLSPRTSIDSEVYASTGFVGREASRWWGSSQAILSLAATKLGARITIAPPTYNVPAHIVQHAANSNHKIRLEKAILVHYHWLLDQENVKDAEIFYRGHALPRPVLHWLKQRIPLRDNFS